MHRMHVDVKDGVEKSKCLDGIGIMFHESVKNLNFKCCVLSVF